MREIIFRGKRIDNGEWVYGHYVHQYGANMIYLPNGVDYECGFDYYHIDPHTLGQYTGLTDGKNGKKIFEGDIITANVYEREYEDDYLSNNPIKVSYCRGYFYPFHLEGAWRSGVSNIEIIGNIHDNPELLKGGVQE